MYKKIVSAVFPDAGNCQIAKHASELSRRCSAELKLIHGIEPLPIATAAVAPAGAPTVAELQSMEYAGLTIQYKNGSIERATLHRVGANG